MMSNKPIQPTCPDCGSSKVVCDAYVKWNWVVEEWELHSTYDHKECSDCGYESNNFNWEEVRDGGAAINTLAESVQVFLFLLGMAAIIWAFSKI